jgi:hypothetical protein
MQSKDYFKGQYVFKGFVYMDSMKAYRGIKSVAPHILSLGARRR